MTPIAIQSQDSRHLFDVIDNLRSQGLDRYVNLPQIVVCGDQSSGKSSVLEAISGFSFPTKDNLCTRFPTELILRRDPVRNVSVSILPHHGRSEDEKAKLEAFTATIDADRPDIGPVIEAAKEAMGIGDVVTGSVVNGEDTKNSRRFSNDVLRVELSGPTQLHLTLVDLPGLFQAGNSEQSADEAPVVETLVLEYMKSKRSIILAVVSAANDFANQSVTRHARYVDPHGRRTLGLITKPDKLETHSETERAYVKTAMNADVKLQLGWHVLRNRGFGERDFSSEERNAKEKEFFSNKDSAWLAVSPENLGIDNLRLRLSAVLNDQIILQLPTLVQDVEKVLETCNQNLARLGTARSSISEQRQYLLNVSSRFTDLMRAAVDGNYSDAVFFGHVGHVERADVSSSGGNTIEDKYYLRRLRAVVQNRLMAFTKKMHGHGETRKIVADDAVIAAGNTATVTRSNLISEVQQVIQRSRGRELPGMYNPLVVGELFRDQSKKWGSLTEECIEGVLQLSYATVKAALEDNAVQSTADGILQTYINPAISALKKGMTDMAQVLNDSHTRIHPITTNHYLTDNVQNARQERLRLSLEKSLLTLCYNPAQGLNQTADVNLLTVANLLTAKKTEPDMERDAAADAIDYMEAYYKVALKRYIDNVCVLVIEQHLIGKLASLFTPNMIYGIPDATVARFAEEAPEVAAKRLELLKQKDVLESGIHELKRLKLHNIPNASQWTCHLDASDGGSKEGSSDEKNDNQNKIEIATPTRIRSTSTDERIGSPVSEKKTRTKRRKMLPKRLA